MAEEGLKGEVSSRGTPDLPSIEEVTVPMEEIVKLVEGGRARPWYAPDKQSKDGRLKLVGVTVSAIRPGESGTNFEFLPDDGMGLAGKGKLFLAISLEDKHAMLFGTSDAELLQMITPSEELKSVPRTVNFTDQSIWEASILPGLQNGRINPIDLTENPGILSPILRATMQLNKKLMEAQKPPAPLASIKVT